MSLRRRKNISRVNVVRNHHITKDAGEAGFFDASIWEDAKKHGDDSIKRLINTNLNNTSVTCALIGTNTWSRRWVRYEILKSYDRGNTLFGVHIKQWRNRGYNFSNWVPIYNWCTGDGYNNFATWVDSAK
ncbi:MAG: TIR domain-containing protein [Sphingobacteriaceae bacterium]|nr:TIR domain-containing protein [Sphingobacteriaceae bacterium]